MLKKRRPIRFSSVELLERIWLKKRTTFASLHAAYRTISLSVLHENLTSLETAGLVRRRKVNISHKPGPRWHYWRITDKGKRLLRQLMPYRDYWEIIQPREVRALALAEGVLMKVERRHAEIFGEDGPKVRKPDYWAQPWYKDPTLA